MPAIKIGPDYVGDNWPVYFIADLGANHDGDLTRALWLIHEATGAGANAVKFQHFRAEHIVSAEGFDALGDQVGHQATWGKPVTEVYQDVSLPWEWTPILARECDRAGVTFLSTPYDFDAVDMLEPYVPAYKVGSGDISYGQLLHHAASKGKPIILSTGASNLDDVERAVEIVDDAGASLILLQCNTNYEVDPVNFFHINLRVLDAYGELFPWAVLGVSDHTPGHSTVLGAIALGAKVIEKHFTDDNSRVGPDHAFAMTPDDWREMVDRTRELEAALGDGVKRVEENEEETVIVQRRCLRAARDLSAGTPLYSDMLVALRPAPVGSIPPNKIGIVLNLCLEEGLRKGEALRWQSFVKKEGRP